MYHGASETVASNFSYPQTDNYDGYWRKGCTESFRTRTNLVMILYSGCHEETKAYPARGTENQVNTNMKLSTYESYICRPQRHNFGYKNCGKLTPFTSAHLMICHGEFLAFRILIQGLQNSVAPRQELRNAAKKRLRFVNSTILAANHMQTKRSAFLFSTLVPIPLRKALPWSSGSYQVQEDWRPTPQSSDQKLEPAKGKNPVDARNPETTTKQKKEEESLPFVQEQIRCAQLYSFGVFNKYFGNDMEDTGHRNLP